MTIRLVNNTSKEELIEKVRQATNMTQLVKLLNFSDGDSTRLKIKALLNKYEISTAHFRSHKPPAPDEVKKARRAITMAKSKKKEKEKRKNLESQELFLFKDSRRQDLVRGRQNDLTIDFIKNLIKEGCSYCGAGPVNKTKLSLDRIDNSLGHLQTNVVSSCLKCNLIRRDMPYAAWLHILPKIKECYALGLLDGWYPGCNYKADIAA